MKHYLILYFVTLIIMTALDMVWIAGIAREFYKSRIPNLEFHPIPAVLFYLSYAIGVVIFVNGGAGATVQSAVPYGILFGFFAYGTYDLTNLATLRGWSPLLAAVDIAWGTLVTAVASAGGLWVASYIKTAV